MKKTSTERPAEKSVSIGPGTVHTTINRNIREREDGLWEFDSVAIVTTNQASADDIRIALIKDIDQQTDEKILKGFRWQPAGDATDMVSVWLSPEKQFDFKAAYDLAVQTGGENLPVKFKLGEDNGGIPVYHTFENMEEFSDFYMRAFRYINQCLVEGWAEKDGLDEWIRERV